MLDPCFVPNRQNTFAGPLSTFDMLVVQSESARESSAGILFLHTSGANFALQGWLMAQCVRGAGAITLCPSMGPAGNWATDKGETIIRGALQYLRRSGIERIYLSAISEGAGGALQMARLIHSELAGLILISGIDPALPPPPLPMLVLRGARDSYTPAALFRKYARKAGKNCTLRELPGDHFLLPRQRTAVARTIAAWLRQQSTRRLRPLSIRASDFIRH